MLATTGDTARAARATSRLRGVVTTPKRTGETSLCRSRSGRCVAGAARAVVQFKRASQDRRQALDMGDRPGLHLRFG